MRASFRYWLAGAAALCSLASGSDAARAQVFGPLLDAEIPFDLADPERPTVLERPRPEIAALGIGNGPFLILPEVEITPAYTSNVYGDANDGKGDAFIIVNPQIDARSRWSRHMLNARVEGTFRRYASNAIRDQNGYNALVEGRLDMPGKSNVYGQVRAEKTYVEQYSGDFPSNAAGSVPLRRQSGVLRGTYQRGRVRLTGNADVNRFDFVDTRALNGSLLDQDFRDETVYRLSTRAEYRVGPARTVFVQATHAIHDYTRPTVGQPDRSGHETRLLAGIAFYPTPLIRTRVAAGYLWRQYDDPRVSDLSGLAVDIQADYLMTQLTTISLAARREAQDAILTNSPGYVATRVQARVDHELLRNLLLRAQVDYERDKFIDIDRRDTLFRLEAGATYTPHRRLVFDPTAQFIKRDSKGTSPGQRFDELRFLLRTTFRF